MLRIAAAGVLLALAAAPGAAQQRSRVPVAVPTAESSDSSADLAARLTEALRTTVEETTVFELYDTAQTRKSIAGTTSQNVAARLPTRYVCVARVRRTNPGWAQVTISFVDAPFKDPVVRLGSPVLLRSDSAFLPVARLAWERLSKLEIKRLDSLRGRGQG